MTSAPHRGFAFLYVVLVVGAIMTALALAASQGGAFAGGRLRAYQGGAEARVLLNRCAETVLMLIRNTTTLTGTNTILADGGSCTYTITGSSVPKTVTLAATEGSLTKRATITVTAISPTLGITYVETQ